ncbi:MAG: ImmA/IrrE family metallo-endopeptidase [Candidatus Binataceae bacterium]
MKPELLVWARRASGLSLVDVANKLKLPLEKIRDWEEGRLRPSVAQLRRLAAIYKRPLAVFYLPNPPTEFQPMHDFRRLPEHFLEESSNLLLEIRKAHYRRDVALDLYSMLGETAPQLSARATLDDDAEATGERMRSLLQITSEACGAWNSEYEALRGWRSSLENAGVMVFQAADVEINEMRGFSLALNPLPVIVVNIKDTPRARIFTLLHEFSHLMLMDAGLCDLNEGARQAPRDQQIEIHCNRVAGAVLVPERELLSEELVAARPGRVEWSDEQVAFLARKYWVSREVVLRRLLIADRTTTEFYNSKRRQYEQEYRSRAGVPGFVLPHVAVLSRSGDLFVRLVLESYAQEKITSSDLSDLLEVRLKHLSKIEDALLRRSHPAEAEA